MELTADPTPVDGAADGPATDPSPASPERTATDHLRAADELVAAGQVREAIELLRQANRRHPSHEVEVRLVQLRNEAFALTRRAPGGSVEASGSVTDPASWPPEVEAADLRGADARAAVRTQGALAVRGLAPPDRVAELVDDIDRALTQAQELAQSGRTDPTPWYDPITPAAPTFDAISRTWTVSSGVVWAGDSPRTHFHLVELLHATGLVEVMTEYLGERPVLSLEKCTVRRTEPDVDGGWHQDARFLEAPAVNLWLALSDCGADSPGIEILPRRIDEVLPTGGGVYIDWVVSQDVIERHIEATPPVRPLFRAGDALLFDGYLVHKTSSDERFTKPRYALECWFFPESSFPATKWTPLVL